jgi:hypothetical protein
MKYKTGSFIVFRNKEHLKGLKANVQAVYLWICSHADTAGKCFPSEATLAREAGLSKRKVSDCTNELVKRGLIRKRQRVDAAGDLTSNLYQIIDMGDALPARGVEQTLPEGMAAAAEITKSIKQNKEEDTSSYDDAPNSSFKKNAIKTQTYLKNEVRLNELLTSGEFEKSKYEFSASGPYDWRYVVNHGKGLTPERYMLAVYWREKSEYTKLQESFFSEMVYEDKDRTDALIKRDINDARALARCIEFKQLPRLIEIADEKAWDEKRGEYAWEWKLHTLLKYIEQLPP